MEKGERGEGECGREGESESERGGGEKERKRRRGVVDGDRERKMHREKV